MVIHLEMELRSFRFSFDHVFRNNCIIKSLCSRIQFALGMFLYILCSFQTDNYGLYGWGEIAQNPGISFVRCRVYNLILICP